MLDEITEQTYPAKKPANKITIFTDIRSNTSYFENIEINGNTKKVKLKNRTTDTAIAKKLTIITTIIEFIVFSWLSDFIFILSKHNAHKTGARFLRVRMNVVNDSFCSCYEFLNSNIAFFTYTSSKINVFS